MPDRQVRVTFQPRGRVAFALPGTKILEVAARAGLAIDTPCGGTGTCGKCRVQIVDGTGPPTEADRRVFDGDELRDGWRLACQAEVRTESVVRVPERSLFAGQHQILSTSHIQTADGLRPAVRKQYVKLPAPTLEDDAPDLLRLEQQVGAFKTDLSLLRRLPGILRDNDFKGTAVLSDHRLIDFEPGDTTSQCCGVAFDIGTTTMVGSLLDLCSGEELGVVSRMNPQVGFGDDVLSRIKHSSSCPDCLQDLRWAAVAEVASMIDTLCVEAGVRREHVYEVVFAGNTTMEHLLCGIDPRQLGEIPFVPVQGRGLLFPARELEIPINSSGTVYVFPVIGGFVGGDTVAGMLATRLDSQTGPALMVDIGTNGEIVLVHDGGTWAASTAAGPAFEGARISCGMRATRGAIEKVVVDGDLQCGVIGDTAPVGLCGSGLIDLTAQLLEQGVISVGRRLLLPEDLPDSVPDSIRRRVRSDTDGQPHFLIAERLAGAPGPDVTLTQRDVRELQLASGAIRAGIRVLLSQAGLQAKDLKSVMIAGGFGSFIRRSSAQRIGLLPPEVDHRRVHYVGNVSLSGAKWALLSTEARKQAEGLARGTRHVQLSTDGDFQSAFAEAMIFPK